MQSVWLRVLLGLDGRIHEWRRDVEGRPTIVQRMIGGVECAGCEC